MSLSLIFQSRRGRQAFLGFCLLLIAFILIWDGNWYRIYSVRHYFSLSKYGQKVPIIMWTVHYENMDKLNKIIDPICITHVELTSDRVRLKDAAAVVFSHSWLNLKDLPPFRTPQQLWVLLSQESPISCKFKNLAGFNNLFNVTMSYRLDSDSHFPYGYAKELKTPLNDTEDIMINNMNLTSFIKKKSKLFATVVSHCPTQSKREKATELMKPNIDIYGACGKRICPRFPDKKKPCDRDEIWRNISRDYKFYFAAENSICHDYITEKFWRSLKIGVVPVVYGGGNYKAVAPPHSYIDSRDFESPGKLVQFLKHLENNVDEYAKYFEWRRRYEVGDTYDGWCKLVKYIQQLSILKPRFHPDIEKWWTTKPHARGGHVESACSLPFWTL